MSFAGSYRHEHGQAVNDAGAKDEMVDGAPHLPRAWDARRHESVVQHERSLRRGNANRVEDFSCVALDTLTHAICSHVFPFP